MKRQVFLASAWFALMQSGSKCPPIPMLVFIDESGDPGLKTDQGSSRFFTIGLVVFEDHDEAQACDDRITLLKRELGWSADSEFHFKTNSNCRPYPLRERGDEHHNSSRQRFHSHYR